MLGKVFGEVEFAGSPEDIGLFLINSSIILSNKDFENFWRMLELRMP